MSDRFRALLGTLTLIATAAQAQPLPVQSVAAADRARLKWTRCGRPPGLPEPA
jgi:hypothetical protein